MIQDIRWLIRDGKAVLQVARYGQVGDGGEIKWEWVDVLFETEAPADA